MRLKAENKEKERVAAEQDNTQERDTADLFKVNRVSNALDIVNKMCFKSSSTTEAIAKIEKLSKLVLGANVTIKDIFMAQAIKDNNPDGGRIALINT